MSYFHLKSVLVSQYTYRTKQFYQLENKNYETENDMVKFSCKRFRADN